MQMSNKKKAICRVHGSSLYFKYIILNLFLFTIFCMIFTKEYNRHIHAFLLGLNKNKNSLRIRIKHLFKRRFLQVNNNISYKVIYRHTIYK